MASCIMQITYDGVLTPTICLTEEATDAGGTEQGLYSIRQFDVD